MENIHLHFMAMLHAILGGVAGWEYTIELFCIVLVGGFVIGWFKTYTITGSTIKSFSLGADIVGKYSSAESHNSFYENFDTISREIREVPKLGHFWHEFSESTFHDAANRQICLSIRPAYYFNKQTALGANGNLNQVQAFPNYLIGMGLFFTFLGLASALYVAQAGLSSGDQQALQDLLKVASIKFVSSLFAVLLSLILSFTQRWLFYVSKKKIASFCDLIEQHTEYLPSEKILMQSLDVQREQQKYQADMAMNIAKNLGELLSKSLPDSVANALLPLTEEIRGLAAKFQGGNQDALQSVLEEFLKQLRSTAGQDMEALVSSVKTLKVGLDTLVVKIGGLEGNFGNEMKDATERLASTIGEFTAGFSPIQAGFGKFGEAIEALIKIADKIEKAGGSIGNAADTQSKSAENLGKSLSGVSDLILPIKDAMAQLQESLRQVTGTANAITQAGGTIGKAAIKFSESANQMDGSLQNFSQTADRISTTVVSLDRASQNVSNASSPLAQASEGIAKVASSMQQTETRLQQSQQLLQAMLEQIAKVEENMPRILTVYEQRFGKVDEDLGNAFTQLSEGSAQFQNAVHEFVTGLDRSFKDALGSLSGVVEELAEAQGNQTQRIADVA